MTKFDILTIFPELVNDYKKISIVARAISKKLISVKAHNLRDFTKDTHQTVDGRPYGGGFGMVLKPDVMHRAIKKISGVKNKSKRIILLTPQGKVFHHKEAKRLAKYKQLIFICGRYEGFDERIRTMVDEQFSIGDYVLMGGELPALVMVEAISRFLPGVVGKEESVDTETFSDASGNMLEYPQYTRPEVLEVQGGKRKKIMGVPKVLLSGNHAEISKWRKAEALKKTKLLRPDLIK